ncbi:sodium:solute symporter [Alienimonas chondri]|uniref:Sodium/glucose cotransporter n=1 Tax=Alienimonas chondri TaxID=2681879 RepID=A0ABX1VAB5_9PLAN|nr:sodium:solute symporter [Alienimonas chondri]NNJ24381.1 Sodium/glucose cotransporter [Alienimonas chondri]
MIGAFSAIDWIVLAVYFTATMALGFAFARRGGSSEGFTTGNRSLPGWVCGLSIFATYLSSISYLALPGKSFADNWNPFVFSLAIPIATLIAVKWFVPYYRASRDVSAYAALERRFGLWARIYVSVFYLLTQIARMGVVMYLMALPMRMLLGWDMATLILVTGVSVTIYSFVGGIAAVIWADAIQAIVLSVGAVACLIAMLWAIPGGVGTVVEVAAEQEKFSFGSWSIEDWTTSTVWVVLLYGIVINLQNFGVDQSYVQRYIAADSDVAAKKSLWLGGLLYVPMSALFFFIGTTLFVYYQSLPESLADVRNIVAEERNNAAEPGEEPTVAAELTNSNIGDRVFPYFIVTQMPAGLRGLLIAAIFAAAMSTVSTSLNSSATLILEDFYKRFFSPEAGETASVTVLRVATVMWGVLGTGMALALIRLTDSALDIWWMLASIFSGGIVGLFLLGMASRTNSAGAAIAVVCGLHVVAWMALSPTDVWPDALADYRYTLHPNLTAVIGTAIILGVGFLAGIPPIGRRPEPPPVEATV